MIIQADLFIFILASIISFTLSSPCKISVQCSCKSTVDNIGPICAEEDTIEDSCSRWPGCVVCQRGKDCQECPGDHTCTKATTHKGKVRQKRQNNSPGYPVNSMNQGSCPELELHEAGTIRCRYNSRQSICTGSCIPGYRFESRESEKNIQLTCRNGKWSPLKRFPDCESDGSCELEVIGFGGFNCSSNNTGSYCEVTCSRQYARLFHCYPGRGWNPPLPGCVSQIGSPRTTGSSGDTWQPCRCQNNGQCDENGRCICPEGRRGEFCELVSPGRAGCNDPGFIPNGYRRNMNGQDSNHRSSFRDGDSVVYSCSEGFGLQGSTVLTCRTRSWSQAIPRCIPTEGSSSPTDSFGNTRPSCRCQNNGQCDRNGRCICPAGWRGEFCEIGVTDGPIMMCPDPGQVSDAERLNADGSPSVDYQQYQVGQSVAYTCYDGFALQGRSLITCSDSGTWSAGLPICIDSECSIPRSPSEESPQIVYCDNPGSISNGRKVYFPPLNKRTGVRSESNDDDPRFPEGGWLQYSCDDGYELEGEDVLTCKKSGSWSSESPYCIPDIQPNLSPSVTCSNPYYLPIDNGQVVYFPAPGERRRGPIPVPDEDNLPEGARLQYTCDVGYVLSGPGTLTCESSTFWSDTTPSCESSG